MWIKNFFAAIIIISCSHPASAQDTWPSPEVEQMYAHAREYMSMGNLDAAITTYKQLLTFVPTRTGISAELGNAYYLKGDFTDAKRILEKLTDRKDASDTVFQLLAASDFSLKEAKEANKTIGTGIEKFPHSGLLYWQKGMILMGEQNEPDAVKSWVSGCAVDPACVMNFKEAATSFFHCQDVFLGLQYAEAYLAMKHDSTGNDAFKKKFYDAWKTFFNNIDAHLTADASTYEHSVTDIYRQLTPVVSDGISTENLTMVRTRFMMQWKFSTSALFTYQDMLIRNGMFDIYNQWLFGKAESPVQYYAWSQFHENDIKRYDEWIKTNHLQPVVFTPVFPAPTANEIDVLFTKKKKR